MVFYFLEEPVMREKVIGNRIYRYDKGVFSISLVDNQDSDKGIVFYRFNSDKTGCTAEQIGLTENLLEEAKVVLKELQFEPQP